MSRSPFLAKVISRVTNPCSLSVVVLILTACTDSANLWALLGWVLIILLFLVVLPLGYVYVRTSAGRRGAKFFADLTTFLGDHPRDISVLGVFSGLPCVLVLVFLEAPPPLITTFVALLATSLIVALCNLRYGVSYHLAALTVLIIMASLIWGQTYLTLLATLPLIGWAKYNLGEHTPAQLAAGFGLAAVVSGVTLYLLG